MNLVFRCCFSLFTLVACTLLFSGGARAAGVEKSDCSFDSADGRVVMTRFAVPPPPPPPVEPETAAPRRATASRFPGEVAAPAKPVPPPPSPRLPAVIMLPGRQGVEPFRRWYETYASWLAAKGYPVYLLSYYSGPDELAMAARDPQIRRERYDQRLPGWIQRVQDAVTVLASRPDVDPARIALVGFSQGGFLGVGVAAADRRPAALVCVYGGMPAAVRDTAKTLPPTLIVHGEADTVVPVAEARALEAFVTQAGGDAVLAVYPGEGHGFALSLDRPEAKDAFTKTVRFLDTHLKKR